MSALQAVRMGDHAKHGLLPEGRDGAGDESAGRNVAGDGEEDHLVASGGDPGHQRPAHAAMAGALRRRGLQRVAGPAAGQAVASPGAGGETSARTSIQDQAVLLGVRYEFGAPPPPPQPAAPPPPAYQPPPPVVQAPEAQRAFQVFFDFNKSDLTGEIGRAHV